MSIATPFLPSPVAGGRLGWGGDAVSCGDKIAILSHQGREELLVHIILANPRGFCAGVNMAIESLEHALALYGTPLYVYHEIVHNRPVVERFRKRGVVFVDGIDEIPPGSHLLYSARWRCAGRPQGVGPEAATCH